MSSVAFSHSWDRSMQTCHAYALLRNSGCRTVRPPLILRSAPGHLAHRAVQLARLPCHSHWPWLLDINSQAGTRHPKPTCTAVFTPNPSAQPSTSPSVLHQNPAFRQFAPFNDVSLSRSLCRVIPAPAFRVQSCIHLDQPSAGGNLSRAMSESGTLHSPAIHSAWCAHPAPRSAHLPPPPRAGILCDHSYPPRYCLG